MTDDKILYVTMETCCYADMYCLKLPLLYISGKHMKSAFTWYHFGDDRLINRGMTGNNIMPMHSFQVKFDIIMQIKNMQMS